MKFVLVLLALMVAAWMLIKRIGGRHGSSGSQDEAIRPGPPATPTAAPRAMVACAHCGMHVPEEETVADAAGRAYCSDAHRAAGPR